MVHVTVAYTLDREIRIGHATIFLKIFLKFRNFSALIEGRKVIILVYLRLIILQKLLELLEDFHERLTFRISIYRPIRLIYIHIIILVFFYYS